MYEIFKSDKSKGHEGKYQLLENGICCGVYFNKRDAVEALKRLKEAYVRGNYQ